MAEGKTQGHLMPDLRNQKKYIEKELRERGFRITKQRRLIMEIILDSECSCSKEIYYQAHGRDSSIGIATVYRMIKTLEDIGVIDRKNLYRLNCEDEPCLECTSGCTILLKDKKAIRLSKKEWTEALEAGLKMKGILLSNKVETVLMEQR